MSRHFRTPFSRLLRVPSSTANVSFFRLFYSVCRARRICHSLSMTNFSPLRGSVPTCCLSSSYFSPATSLCRGGAEPTQVTSPRNVRVEQDTRILRLRWNWIFLVGVVWRYRGWFKAWWNRFDWGNNSWCFFYKWRSEKNGSDGGIRRCRLILKSILLSFFLHHILLDIDFLQNFYFLLRRHL